MSTTRIGGTPVAAPTFRANTPAPAAAATSTRRSAATDGFDGGGEPSKAEVEAKYNSMAPQDRKALYDRLKKGDESLTPLERKVAMKTAIRRGIIEAFKQMAEEQANQMEMVLNKMNG